MKAKVNLTAARAGAMTTKDSMFRASHSWRATRNADLAVDTDRGTAGLTMSRLDARLRLPSANVTGH
jgi:hypothetical protein